MTRVVAVERSPLTAPAEAILIRESKTGRENDSLVGRNAWESIHQSEFDDVMGDVVNWPHVEIELPNDDWEEGYLQPRGDAVIFVYGPTPKREDWEGKRRSRRVGRLIPRRGKSGKPESARDSVG